MIFGSLFSRSGAKAPAEKAKRSKGGINFVDVLTTPDFFAPPRPNSTTLLKLYRDSPWVRAIVGKVGQGVAKHKFFLETPDGERIDKHPVLTFLRAGSPKLRGRQAVKVTQLHIDLTGEAFWAIGRDGSGTPVQFAPIPPHWVTDIPSTGSDFYDVQPVNGQGLFRIPARDVLMFRDADPLEPYERGVSLTGAAITEIQTDEAAADFLRAFFKNRARPDLVVSGTKEHPLDDKGKVALETVWRERFEGVKRAGRPFFSRAPLNVAEVGKGLRDNDVSAIRDQIKATLTEIYGIPPEILGRLESSNRATIESADYLYGRHTLEPRLSFLVDVLEPWALENFVLGELFLKTESPVEDDRTHALAVMSAFPGSFTGNEKRALAKLRPRDDQDDLPEFPTAPAKPPGPGAPKEPDEEPEPAAKSVAVSKTIAPADIVRVSQAHEDPQVRAQITKLFDDVFGELIDKYGSELLETLANEATFQRNSVIADFILREVPFLIQRVDDTTRVALQSVLLDGSVANEALDALIARVTKVFDDAASGRSSLIGDTEATKITGFASQVAAEQGGFERKMWLTSQDLSVRHSHAAMNRQTKGVREKFQSPRGGQAMHPGAFGSAAEDINCRCAMRPVLSGEKAEGVDKFEAMHDRLFSEIAKKISVKMEDVFGAQKVVVTSELRRVFAGRRA